MKKRQIDKDVKPRRAFQQELQGLRAERTIEFTNSDGWRQIAKKEG